MIADENPVNDGPPIETGGSRLFQDCVERIVCFLDQMVASREPTRDIAEGKALREQLLALFDQSEDWDLARDEVGAAVAERLQARAADWNQTIHLLAVYVDAIDSAAHPRAGKPSSWRPRTGGQKGSVALDLSCAVLSALLRNASEDGRLAFYRSISNHSHWDIAASSFADLKVRSEEILGFVSAYSQKVAVELIGHVADGIARWAAEEPVAAREFVERWLRSDLGYREVPPHAIQVIAQAVTLDAESKSWRDSLIEDLLNQSDPECSRIAAAIELLAWPLGTPISLRCRALVVRARSKPVMLPGIIHALTREARAFPMEVLDTLKELLSLSFAVRANPQTRLEIAAYAAPVAMQLSFGMSDKKIAPDCLVCLLPALVNQRPRMPQVGAELDMLLSVLLETRPDDVRHFLEAWFSLHAQEIVTLGCSLRELMGQVSYRLTPNGEDQLLVGALCSTDDALRAVSCVLLASGSRGLGGVAFAKLTDGECVAVAHELVAHGILGPKLVGSLFSLARARRAVLPEILTIVLDDLSEDFSGATRKSLDIWAKADGTSAEHRALREAASAVEMRLKKLDDAHRARIAIPETLAVIPAMIQWQQAEQRIAGKSFRAAQARSVFASIMTHVPIGRGSQTTFAAGPPSQIMEHEFSYEGSLRLHTDPVDVMKRRMLHLKFAAQLRARAREVKK